MDNVLVNHNKGLVASLCTRSESVAITWMSGELVGAVSSVKTRQQGPHC